MPLKHPVRRILVFRFGSIGDFIVAIPSLRLIRKNYPDAEIALLSDRPADSRAASPENLLDGTGLIDLHLKYSGGTRNARELIDLRKIIRHYKPDLFVYLAPERGFFPLFRDYLFFRLCGLSNILGFPNSLRDWKSIPPSAGSLRWEQEAYRLVRLLAPLGTVDLENRENWDLNLSPLERRQAARLLEKCAASKGVPLIALSIGTKQPINDWGDRNWVDLLDGIKNPLLGLVLIGSAEDRERSERLTRAWPGPVINICGLASPRVSAAVLQRTILFLGHDSGPMHLAAVVGRTCIAVFSKRNPPGTWFPVGQDHRIIYPCWRDGTIHSIRPRQVIEATLNFLGKHWQIVAILS